MTTDYCVHCNGSGFAFSKDERGYEFLLRCRCPVGQAMPREARGKSNTGPEIIVQIHDLKMPEN